MNLTKSRPFGFSAANAVPKGIERRKIPTVASELRGFARTEISDGLVGVIFTCSVRPRRSGCSELTCSDKNPRVFEKNCAGREIAKCDWQASAAISPPCRLAEHSFPNSGHINTSRGRRVARRWGKVCRGLPSPSEATGSRNGSISRPPISS